jgi:hypothetical protein
VTTLYKKYICLQGIIYNPSLKGCVGGGIILKDIISRTFNYAEKNGHLKDLISRTLNYVKQNGYLKIVIKCA